MDQNTPRDDATGAQPPAEPASSDASAWNQQDQAATTDQSQPGASGGQEPATEYAAWSADASYQQQAAAQGQPAQPADTQAYAAPEPQSATYSEQPAATADQQYAQQQYQQPQQQAYDQQTYDQQAYAQQQQQYQQQYYDQSAYGQQPSYYDQQSYAQQQYQQQPQGYQQPTQPYAYGQPAQPWPAEEPYWEQETTGYGRSFLAILGGFALLTWGIVFAMGGALILWLGGLTDVVADMSLSAAAQDLVDEFNSQSTGYGGILLIAGLVQMIGAVGILAHRKWGRAFGIVLGLLGTIWGVALLISSITFDAGDVTVEGAFSGEAPALGAAILVLVSYLIVFLGMFMGRRHFRKKGVSG